MTLVFAGLALGVAGSLHCAVMCGPLVAALHGRRSPRRAVLHHAGRISVYAAAGIAAGAAGEALALRQLGRALSVAAGVALIAIAAERAGMLPLSRRAGGMSVVSAAMRALGRIRDKSPALAALGGGAINALLPCGLLYAAMAAAAATASPSQAFVFMLSFGVATAPALMAVPWVAGRMPDAARARLRFAVPAAFALAGVMLVMRGAAGHH